MVKRRGIFIFLLFVYLIGFLGGVLAQRDISGIVSEAEKGRGLLEGEKWKYLGSEWNELLLKHPVISAVDGFFNKINFVIVVLFGRDYDLSLTLFFAFLLWLFTLLSLERYARGISILKTGWQQFLVALAATVILAQTQIFNYVSDMIFRAVFYRQEWYWSFLIFILICVIIVIYYFFNIYFAKYLEAMKNTKEAKELKKKVRRTEIILEGAEKGLK